MEEGEASHGLQRPPEFYDLFTEEGWALMSEVERRQMIEIMNRKEVITDETRRIHKKIIVGNGTPNLVLPDGSPGRTWRIFTDPNAARKLVSIANKYHWEKERKQREALLRKSERKQREALLRKSEREQREALLRKQFARAVKCEDDDGCSADGNENKARTQRPMPELGLSDIQLQAGLPHHDPQIYVSPEVAGSGVSALALTT